MGLGDLRSVQLQLSWSRNDRNFHVPTRDNSKGYLKQSDKLLISVNLLGTLVLLPNCLLGMLGSIKVKFVQIFDAWEQIFQGVSSHLYQGFGLGTEHKVQFEQDIC